VYQVVLYHFSHSASQLTLLIDPIFQVGK
jgi:hypothetical protein